MNKTKILVSPLTNIQPILIKNENFRKDLTNVNREMYPKLSVSETAWEKMPDEEKTKLLAEGYSYSFLHFFIYDENDIFEEITYKYKVIEDYKSRCRMIDFGNIYQVDCKEIESASKYPKDIKILELTVESRKELRDKLSHFYSRPTTEDLAKL